MKTIISIIVMLVVAGCLSEVETEGQDVKDEPSIPEGNELPPPAPAPPLAPSTNK